MWDIPVTQNDRVNYCIYVKKSGETDWTYITTTSQHLISITNTKFDGTYTEFKVATLLDSEEVKSVVATDLTLVVNRTENPNPAEAIFKQVPEESENTYKISVKGLTPNSEYNICLKETPISQSMSSYSAHTDSNGDDIAQDGEYSSGSSLKNRIQNGYYLVHDFSSITLSQDEKL